MTYITLSFRKMSQLLQFRKAPVFLQNSKVKKIGFTCCLPPEKIENIRKISRHYKTKLEDFKSDLTCEKKFGFSLFIISQYQNF